MALESFPWASRMGRASTSPLGVENGARVDEQGDGLAVSALPLHLLARPLAGEQVADQAQQRPLREPDLVEDIRDQPAADLIEGDVGHRRESGVDPLDARLGIREHHRAVGPAGDESQPLRVALGLVEGLLELHALGDVEMGSGQADGLPVRVPLDDAPAHQHPDPLPVLRPEPELRLVDLDLTGEVLPDELPGPLLVVGVEKFLEERLADVGNLALRVPEHRRPAFVDVHDPRDQIPLPETEVGAAQRQVESPFPEALLEFGVLAVRDVVDHQVQRVAAREIDHAGVDLDVAFLPVVTAVAALVAGVAAGARFGEALGAAAAVADTEIPHRLPAHLLAGPAVELAGDGVGVEDPGGIGVDHQVDDPAPVEKGAAHRLDALGVLGPAAVDLLVRPVEEKDRRGLDQQQGSEMPQPGLHLHGDEQEDRRRTVEDGRLRREGKFPFRTAARCPYLSPFFEHEPTP
jgi:hypothetical protein